MRSKKLKYISGNDKGFALVMVLLIAAISLAITAGLIYMITAGTQMSGGKRGYERCLVSASEEEIVPAIIKTRDGNLDATLATAINYNTTTPVTCATGAGSLPDGTSCADIGNYTGIATKLKLPRACWASCDNSLAIDTTSPSTYDFSFEGGGCITYGKIVDATMGNTQSDPGVTGELVKTGVVLEGINPNAGSRSTIPYLYTVELHVQNISSPTDKVKLSILYGF